MPAHLTVWSSTSAFLFVRLMAGVSLQDSLWFLLLSGFFCSFKMRGVTHEVNPHCLTPRPRLWCEQKFHKQEQLTVWPRHWPLKLSTCLAIITDIGHSNAACPNIVTLSQRMTSLAQTLATFHCNAWGVLTVGVKSGFLVEEVSSVSGQFPVNFNTKWLLWHVHVHLDCASSHKTLAAEVPSAIFRVNFNAKWLLWHVHVHLDCASSHKTLAPG